MIKRYQVTTTLSVLVMLLVACGPTDVEARGIGSAIAKSATKRAAAREAVAVESKKDWERIYARDVAKHAKPAQRLRQDRLVDRYTSREKAEMESREGLAPGTHMSAKAKSGRPYTADRAQRRYGIQDQVEVRETILLPKGFPVRANKVEGGEPGVGELTSPARIPPNAIRRVTPVSHEAK